MSLQSRINRAIRDLKDSGATCELEQLSTSQSRTDSKALLASRRQFIKQSVLAGGGLALAVSLGAPAVKASSLSTSSALADFQPNAYVRISPDNTISLIAMHDEMGQGIHTGLAMAICEELEVPVSKVNVISAPANQKYAHKLFGLQISGGSSSTYSSLDAMREAGAVAREMLRSAAAKLWSVDLEKCVAEDGLIKNGTSGETKTYGELAATASELEVPSKVTLKDQKNYKVIGKPTHRVDSPAKVRGKAIFSLDQKAEGMLTAMVERCPYFGGKLIAFDASDAEKIKGVKKIVQVPSGVAVIADGYWPAFKARKKLKIQWQRGRGGVMDCGELRNQYRKLSEQEGLVADSEGDFGKSLSEAEDELDVLYEVPFQAHAPMEPLSCMVTLKPDDGAYLVTGSQMLGVDHMVACQRLGVGPEKVVIENSYLGGGFGRRANPASDFTLEALEVAIAAKDLQVPIKTVWSREDDIRGGWYRPMYTNRMTASLKDGKITGWRHRIVGQSIMDGTILASAMIQDGIDTSTVEGAWHLPYAVPNKTTELHTVDIPVPIQWWRSVGHSNTAFAKESFIDECAERLNKDPYQFRRELLSEHPRLLRVLDLAAEKSGWGDKPADGVGRGIAVHESFESFVAHVVEASVEDGIPKIHRIVCAVDCGPVVNPDQVEAQLQGGAMFALSSVLEGKIRFKNGRVMESNFGDFKVVRMNQSPKIECHIVPSTDSMGGLGEPGVPTVASAVCSAIHAACGKRIRRLPIGNQLQG